VLANGGGLGRFPALSHKFSVFAQTPDTPKKSCPGWSQSYQGVISQPLPALGFYVAAVCSETCH